MNQTHLVHRVSTALAEWASDNKLRGMSDWSPHDFATDAKKFTEALEKSVAWHSRLNRQISEESYRTNVTACLDWSLNGRDTHGPAIDVCLFEIGPDLTGLEFDSE